VVVRDVESGGAAAAAGLQPGDVITQVNREAVRNPGELRSALDAAGDRPALLLVTRDGSEIFLTIRPRA
jgi:S1-C subfamily serine protease